MTTDSDSFLMGAVGRSAKFEKPGDQVLGVVMNAQMRQQTDFKTKAKKHWDDGNPMMELVVTLLTEEHTDDDDDGLRKVYIKGQMQKAVADAVRGAGGPGVREGGTLFVRYTGDGAATGGLNPPKLYLARYKLPETPVQGDIDPDDVPF